MTSLIVLLALIALCFAQSGCMTADVRLANFMSRDRAPRTAMLPRGYAVQDLVIHRGDRAIGMTHAHHPASRSVVIFCGGDTFHRSIDGAEALESLALGADVVLFDYPGYGDSSGSPTPASLIETALAVYDYVDALQTSAGKKRVLYGFSLGGLVAARVARERAADGLVLEATAANAMSWARSRIPWYLKPLVRPRVEPALADVDTPSALAKFRGLVLVLGSRADRHAPEALSREIFKKLVRQGVATSLVVFARAAHGEINHSKAFAPVFRHFLESLQEPQWASLRD
ncbi:MAG TPA: alpha/beta fold hydrolase [Steroidobacteraceae bacterium]|nr:alpha/beta fold hydrolase [Steroidobacteraceae bacterium]